MAGGPMVLVQECPSFVKKTQALYNVTFTMEGTNQRHIVIQILAPTNFYAVCSIARI